MVSVCRRCRVAPTREAYWGSNTESSVITTPTPSANQATAHATFLPFLSAGGGVWKNGPSIGASSPCPLPYEDAERLVRGTLGAVCRATDPHVSGRASSVRWAADPRWRTEALARAGRGPG